jgi:hypothetical protein
MSDCVRPAGAARDLLPTGAISPMDVLRGIEKLKPFVEKLDDATTCRICLDSMTAPCRLSCGHQFCGPCIERILLQPKSRIRCALCKHPTSKRSIRSAPIPLAGIIASIHELTRLLDATKTYSCDLSNSPDRHSSTGTPAPKAPMNDGFLTVNMSAHRQFQINNTREHHDVSASDGHTSVASTTPPPRRSTDLMTSLSSPCAFCPLDFDYQALLPPDVILGPVITVHPPSRTKHCIQVHEECALHSRGVYLQSEKLINVHKVLSGARGTCCAEDLCKRKGATVHCAADGCTMAYHFVCALVQNCLVVDDGSFQVFCIAHRNLAPVLNADDFEHMKVDPESPDCKDSRDECFVCGFGGQLLLCDGCDRSTHVGCSGLKALPIGDWHCQICKDGLGNSINKENTAPIADIEGIYSSGYRRPRQRKRSRLMVSEQEFLNHNRFATALVAIPSGNLPDGNSPVALVTGGSNHTTNMSHPVYKRICRGENQMVVLPTGLSEATQALLKIASRRFKLNIAHTYSPRVTHILISCYGPDEVPVRTVKLCKGLVANLPVICFQWIHEAVYGGDSVCPPVDKFLHSYSLRTGKQALFSGLRFFFARLENCATSKEDLMEIVKIGKGSIMFSEPTVHTSTLQGPIYIVRSSGKPSDGTHYSRQRRASDIALPPGCELISPEWILDQCVPVTRVPPC